MSTLNHKSPVTSRKSAMKTRKACQPCTTSLTCLHCRLTIVTGDLWYHDDMHFVSSLPTYDCNGRLVVQRWHALRVSTLYHKSPVTIVSWQWKHEMDAILVPQVSRYNSKSTMKTRKACHLCTTSRHTIVTGNLWYQDDMPYVSSLPTYDCNGRLVVPWWHAFRVFIADLRL
jgi:hypothetical protein